MGYRVHYVGGTISALPGKTQGQVNTRQNEVFHFQTTSVTVQVPYDKINVREYGQRVSRRYEEAILLSPVFLLSKTKKHDSPLGFTDDQGRQQAREIFLVNALPAMSFEVGKNDVRAMLVVLGSQVGP